MCDKLERNGNFDDFQNYEKFIKKIQFIFRGKFITGVFISTHI